MRILIVEDSESLAKSLKIGLANLGHAVDAVANGERGLAYARKEPYDLIVMDIMMPEMDGLEVLRQLRDDGDDVPVIFLTAKDTVADKVRGLKDGADDYLVKPFAFDELHARIEALARRRDGRVSQIITVGDLSIDTTRRQVLRGSRPVRLNAREYELLVLLASRPGQPVSRIEIEDHRYGEDNFPKSNAAVVAISKLRSLLCENGEPDMIETRRGLGYVLHEPAT